MKLHKRCWIAAKDKLANERDIIESELLIDLLGGKSTIFGARAEVVFPDGDQHLTVRQMIGMLKP